MGHRLYGEQLVDDSALQSIQATIGVAPAAAGEDVEMEAEPAGPLPASVEEQIMETNAS